MLGTPWIGWFLWLFLIMTRGASTFELTPPEVRSTVIILHHLTVRQHSLRSDHLLIRACGDQKRASHPCSPPLPDRDPRKQNRVPTRRNGTRYIPLSIRSAYLCLAGNLLISSRFRSSIHHRLDYTEAVRFYWYALHEALKKEMIRRSHTLWQNISEGRSGEKSEPANDVGSSWKIDTLRKKFCFIRT